MESCSGSHKCVFSRYFSRGVRGGFGAAGHFCSRFGSHDTTQPCDPGANGRCGGPRALAGLRATNASGCILSAPAQGGGEDIASRAYQWVLVVRARTNDFDAAIHSCEEASSRLA